MHVGAREGVPPAGAFAEEVGEPRLLWEEAVFCGWEAVHRLVEEDAVRFEDVHELGVFGGHGEVHEILQEFKCEMGPQRVDAVRETTLPDLKNQLTQRAERGYPAMVWDATPAQRRWVELPTLAAIAGAQLPNNRVYRRV